MAPSELARVAARIALTLLLAAGCGGGRSQLSGGVLSNDEGDGMAGTWLDPPDTTSVAAAYQVNAAHTGAQPLDQLSVPLRARWTRDFSTANLSYPLIARGRVFIVAAGELFALDLESGATAWGPRALGNAFGRAELRGTRSNLAYERGRIFAVGVDGEVQALSTDDGAELWRVALGTSRSIGFLESIPVVYDGLVYLAGENRLFALDGATGVVKWTLPTEACATSGPAVGAAGAFVTCTCGAVYATEPRTGAERWSYPGGCAGGGGGYPVLLAGGYVYTRALEGNLIFDAATGNPVGTLAAGPIPAVTGSLYAVNDGVLVAYPNNVAEPPWSFGDGHLSTAPLVVGKHVVVGSDNGELSLLDARTGELLAAVTLPAGFALGHEDWNDLKEPVTGLNAAADRLVVPNGTAIFVY